MTEPVDAVLAFHNAFRADMSGIDATALAMARGQVGLEARLERFRFFNEVLVWHAKGEELGIFPALELVAPAVAEAYIIDHHYLDVGFETLEAAYTAGDTLEIARAASAFRYHHDIHLAKEDAHLYRLFKQRIALPEQAKALGLMASTVPQARFPEMIAWLFPLIGDDDRENMTRIWQMVIPAPAFEMFKPLIQKATGDGWAELVRRIPTLG